MSEKKTKIPQLEKLIDEFKLTMRERDRVIRLAYARHDFAKRAKKERRRGNMQLSVALEQCASAAGQDALTLLFEWDHKRKQVKHPLRLCRRCG